MPVLSLKELRNNLYGHCADVAKDNTAVILTYNGIPLAAIVSLYDLELLTAHKSEVGLQQRQGGVALGFTDDSK